MVMKVNLAQHVSGVLTSKQSPRGLAGYQTIFYTHELLTQDEVRIIENQTQRVSAENSKVDWQSYRLTPRKHVISRIVPIAEPDEFGRRGRFFAHSLICNIADEQQFDEDMCDLLRPQNFFLSLEQILSSNSVKSGHISQASLNADRKWINEAEHLIREWSGEQLHRLFLLMGDPRQLIETGQYVALIGSEEQILDAMKIAFLLTPVTARKFCSFNTKAEGNVAQLDLTFWGRGYSDSGSVSYVLDAAQRKVTIPESATLLAARFPLEQLSHPLREALQAKLKEPADHELSTLLDRKYKEFIGRPIYQTLLQKPDLSLTQSDLELLTPLGQQYLSLGFLLALKTGDESRRLQLLGAMDSRLYSLCINEMRSRPDFRPWQAFSPTFMRPWFESFRGSYNLEDLTIAIGKIAEHGSKQDRKALNTLPDHLDAEQQQAIGSWLKTAPYRLGALQTALDKSINANSGNGKPNSSGSLLLHPSSKQGGLSLSMMYRTNFNRIWRLQSMICPYCVEDIPVYSKKHDDCKISRGKEFPPLYVDYHSRATEPDPLVLSIIGFGGHGKTVFLCALFHYIDRFLAEKWPRFYNRVLDQESLDTLNANRKKLESRVLPPRTEQIFPRPGIFRLTNMPCIQESDPISRREDTTILIYDPPGEAFGKETKIVEFASFVKRSDCLLFLIDLSAMGGAIASEMAKLLDTYLLGMRRMQIKKKSQHMIVVYTKSDDIRVSVPQFSSLLAENPELEDYFAEQLPETLSNPSLHLDEMEKISQKLEAFTKTRLNAHKFINAAEDWFASVSYTAVSSLGEAPEPYINEEGKEDWRLTAEISPRCVADPLLYVLAKSKKVPPDPPPIWRRLLAQAGFLGHRATVVMLSGLASILIVLLVTTYFLFFYNADFRRASAYVRQKDYASAITNYTRSIEEYPQYAEAYNGRGWAYLEQGNYVEAIKDCNKAIQLKPDFAEALTCRGMASAFNNAYDEALSDCQEAIKHKPEYAAAYLCQGIVHWYQKENAKAIEKYNEAIKFEPGFARAYFYRGIAYADTGNEAEARRNYQKAAELESNGETARYSSEVASAYHHRGLAYHKQEKYKEAIADFDKAIKLNPEYAEAYGNRGLAYRAIGNFEQSIKDFKEAIRLQPGNLAFYIQRGDTYFLKGSYKEAIEDYSKVIEVSPTAEIYVKRGGAHVEATNWEQAYQDYNKALEIKPEYLDAYFGLGTAYLKNGDACRKESGCSGVFGYYHVAVENYTRAINLNPEYALAYYKRGIAEANRNNQGVAIKDFEKAIELDSELESKRNDSYSYAFWRRGEETRSEGDNARYEEDKTDFYSSAIDDFRQALKLNPNNGNAKSSLARLENR